MNVKLTSWKALQNFFNQYYFDEFRLMGIGWKENDLDYLEFESRVKKHTTKKAEEKT